MVEKPPVIRAENGQIRVSEHVKTVKRAYAVHLEGGGKVFLQFPVEKEPIVVTVVKDEYTGEMKVMVENNKYLYTVIDKLVKEGAIKL